MIVIAYLREGRVHASREAFEGGDGCADYSYTMGLDGNCEIEAVIAGQRYKSLWSWPIDAKRPFGAVPLLKIDEGSKK